MNNFTGIGRLTADIELREFASGDKVANFTIAIQRTYKNAQGSYDADFIQCVAFKHTATYLSKYARKGLLVSVIGAIKNSTYQANDGTTRYQTQIVCQQASVLENPNANNNNSGNNNSNNNANQTTQELKALGVDVEDMPF